MVASGAIPAKTAEIPLKPRLQVRYTEICPMTDETLTLRENATGDLPSAGAVQAETTGSTMAAAASDRRLNLGCATQIVDGWTNVDYALGARITKLPFFRAVNRRLKLFNLDWSEEIYLHNLTQTFPWAESSIDAVYSSHTLEHLSKAQGRFFLAECHRVLQKGGVLRIVVPDLKHNVREYLDGRLPADDFVENLGVLYIESDRKWKNRLNPFIQFPHKCMYDSERLVEIFRELGFDASSRAAFDSAIDDIRAIELEDRALNAVIVEGRKI